MGIGTYYMFVNLNKISYYISMNHTSLYNINWIKRILFFCRHCAYWLEAIHILIILL